MAFESYLNFQSQGQTTDTIKILECEYAFFQEIDQSGKPSAKPTGGQIKFVIESSDKELIAEWMFSKNARKNGSIIFPMRNNRTKELKFEDAICISYKEVFNASDNMPMLLQFTISANKIKLGSAEFSNNWKL